MKKILNFIICLFVMFTFTSNIFATENINNISDDIDSVGKHLSYTYYIKNYDIDIQVTEEHVLNITETIDVYFNEKSHGIFRDMSLNGVIYREDGSRSSYNARISNLSVNEMYSESIQNSSRQIKIGNPNKYVIGDKQYIIKYLCKLSGDNSKKIDELYYNIIGTGWQAPIDKVTFKIEMPKEFDEEKLGFTHGRLDSTDTDKVFYEIDGNTIIGEYAQVLSPKEALTIRLELPQGYFKLSFWEDLWLNLIYSVAAIITIIANNPELSVVLGYIICTAIPFVFWYIWKSKQNIIETVEFYPPDNLNSLELGFIHKGRVISSDITSLIIYLANKGYLKIEEDKDDFKIIKLKDYDGENEYEKEVFEGLFKKKDEITKKELSKSFYKVENKIEYNLNKKESREKVIIPETKFKRRLRLLIPVIIGISLLFTIARCCSNEEGAIALCIFGIIICIVFAMGINAKVTKRKGIIVTTVTKGSEYNSKVDFSGKIWMRIGVVLVLIEIFMIIVLLATREMYLEFPYLINTLLGFVSLTATIFFAINIENRTEYGKKYLGKILGFKRFLENARKEELERLVEEHPTYFYDILPYTYVLGISDKWISKFEAINMPSPEWYKAEKSEHEDNFKFVSVTKVLNSTISSANNSRPKITHSSSSSYSSSSSSDRSSSSERRENTSTGGGSAGRGAGGGGGGAW